MSGQTSDQLEILDVLNTYGQGIDRKNLSTVLSCFTDDATFQFAPNPVVPVSQFTEGFEVSWKTFRVTAHNFSNHRVEIAGDLASSSINLSAYHLIAAEAPSNDPLFPGTGEDYGMMIGGRYTDSLIKTRAGWKISARCLCFDWSYNVGKPTLPEAVFSYNH